MILGSKSSKCTEIKTPVDPHKIRFIDNKRISIIIGCVAGILVFIFIIISIVMNREEKEEEAENENESLSGSAATAHKSPGKLLKHFVLLLYFLCICKKCCHSLTT